jgi:hypothetical protein
MNHALILKVAYDETIKRYNSLISGNALYDDL